MVDISGALLRAGVNALKHSGDPPKPSFKDKHKRAFDIADKFFKLPRVKSMKTGGMVKKTQPHLLHKGEMVVPAHLVKHFSGLMKK